MLLTIIALPLAAQDAPQTLPPNYRLIKKLVKKRSSPYYYDSLLFRFNRCDTTFTIDDARCLYFGGTEVSIAQCYYRYNRLIAQLGRHEGEANDVWWQLQMLISAVWSTGDGSKESPLYVQNSEDVGIMNIIEGSGDTLSVSAYQPRQLVFRCLR